MWHGDEMEPGEARGIEWLTADVEDHPASTIIDRRRPRRGLAAAVGAIAVLVVGAVLVTGDDPGAPPTEEVRPTTAPSLPAAPAPPAVRIDADATELPAGARADLTALAGLSVPLELVITSPTSSEAWLVSVPRPEEVRVTAFPRLSDLAFDASGRWLAGVSFTRQGEQRRVLWAGEVGGALEPVAVGIRSFAWHDAVSGLIAWTEPGDPTLVSLDLGSTGSTRHVDLPAAGILQGWGDWGFALQSSPRRFTTSIVSPDGEPVVVDHPGRFAAHLPGSGVLVSGDFGRPEVIDIDSGVVRPVEGLESGDLVWSVAPVSGGHRVLVVPGLGGARTPGTLVALDGTTATDIATTPAITDLAPTPDGDGVVLANQATAGDAARGSIAVYAEDGPSEALVPDLFDGREWVLALASRRPVDAG